ncbi:hypothetical protein [Glycomyces harbinensis]|uniref:Uncharacterized protein n=1 Tax=Glycomyces harbinensis TaxID=58114 RepID=A0A1G7AEV9_9ACTN|nr:hypothetical protein [Glycomyces harbinensis]SDE13488.1 hypothetical protein SAMN05216270_113111 [Glycomyces harbinensis]
MRTPDPSVPWGRPAVASIPLPPFASPAHHQRFTRALQLHVALVDDGAPSLAAKVLGEALAGQGQGADLTRTELDAALSTYFPAPWTPAALAAVLAAHDRFPPREQGGRWNWHYDPDFTATPREEGGWEIESHERGSRRVEMVLESHDDLVLLWMDHFHKHFLYPYGWRLDEPELNAFAAAAKAVRTAHAADAAKPYLRNWRTEREAALGD